jgi:hypothetical protein
MRFAAAVAVGVAALHSTAQHCTALHRLHLACALGVARPHEHELDAIGTAGPEELLQRGHVQRVHAAHAVFEAQERWVSVAWRVVSWLQVGEARPVSSYQ